MRFSVIIYILVSATFAMAQSTYRVSMLMPFSSNTVLNYPNHSNAELGNICRTYYQGFVIGLDSLVSNQKTLRLTVFDTENDSLKTAQIIKQTEFLNSDLIIGPVLQGGNKMVSQVARQKAIYQVSPLMTFSKTKIEDPFWISANPDLPSYARILCNHIVSSTADTVCLVILSDKSTPDNAITPQFKKIASEYKRIKMQVVEYNNGIELQKFMHSKFVTHFFFPSTKEQNCNRMLYQLSDTSSQHQTILYGLSQWFDFKNTDISLWQRKNVHFITPYFINYNDSTVKTFVENYRLKYATEPDEYAFKGFDQARFFAQALLTHGKDFMKKTNDVPYKGLHTSYHFKQQKSNSGYQSLYLNVLKFENNTLIRIN